MNKLKYFKEGSGDVQIKNFGIMYKLRILELTWTMKKHFQ